MDPIRRRSFFQSMAALGLAPASQPAPAIPGRSLPRPVESTGELRRGPYLQAVGPDRVVVRWRTDGGARDGRLRYGDALDALDHVVPAQLVETGFAGTEDWSAVVEGLQPGRSYYYAIEAATAVLAGADEFHSFRTAPVPGQPSPSRFWVLGDCGTNRVGTGNPGKSISARNGFRRFDRGRPPIDGIFLLGDNAYGHGTDAEYQTAVFSVYRDELRRIPVWPCIGNHELTDDYFGIFTVPEHGEAGGVPSGCSNYYSFDHANIHFTVLDLWKAEWKEASSPQRRWLERDLAEAKGDWRIVAEHFPPYCDGKYESDTNGFLVEVREQLLPVLEAHGVDLLLNGHDHTYQRSYLLDGHHGPRSTFDPARHRKHKSDGRTSPIVKGRGPHSGLVVVVTGTAGAEQPADPSNPHDNRLGHPVMVELPEGDQDRRGVRRLGTFLLEIDGLTLVGTQVDHHGGVVDRFTILKQS